ncbi:MAG: purine-nucleoside phosphorylase [Clostridiales bacterium]|nr:purine-nucleoside phosphorylase [Clostridiales bacterium]
MNSAYEKLLKCYEDVRKKVDFKPELALILGSGLGDYAESIQVEAILNYSDIKEFPTSTVEGHKGRFVFGYVGETPIVIMQGRVHYYEGYSMEDVVLPTRLMKLMGAKVLFLTNASGSVNPELQPGDFMMLTDQIASFIPSPLRGENREELGVRFPDMTEVYNRNLRNIIKQVADDLDISVKDGIYIQLPGPQFESPAEIRMCRMLGADAVGMSTACEALAANHMNMKVCGISCITNLGAGMSGEPLTSEEVYEISNRTAPLFKKLLTETIVRIGKYYQ